MFKRLSTAVSDRFTSHMTSGKDTHVVSNDTCMLAELNIGIITLMLSLSAGTSLMVWCLAVLLC